jgi:beta-galactosidase
MPNFYRAAIDNDRSPQIPKFLQTLLGTYYYKKAIKKLKVKKIMYSKPSNSLRVEVYWKMPNMFGLKTIYTFLGNGSVGMEMKVGSRLHSLPRSGFTMKLAAGFNTMSFFGKGPFENYCDRATAAKLAVYGGDPRSFMHEYLYPQENGNHTGCRWLALEKPEHAAMRFGYVAKPFEASVYPYTIEQLDDAKHLHELKQSSMLTVNIDGRQRGVGGDIPAFAAVKKQYKILKNKKHTFAVVLKPVKID